MSDAKRQVLEMLDQKKISEQDAARLLEALGEEALVSVEEAQAEQAAAAAKEAPPAAEIPTWEIPAGDWKEKLGMAVEKASEVLDAEGRALEEGLGAMGEALENSVDKAVKTVTEFFEEPENPPVRETGWSPVWEACPQPGPNAIAYTESFAMEKLEKLIVSWVNGPVELRSWEGEAVRVTEYTSRPLNENQRLWRRASSNCLEIRWIQGKFSFSALTMPQKHLIVELPEHLAGSIEKAKISSVSGNIYWNGLGGEELSLSTVSGGVFAEGMQGEDIHLESVSGRIRGKGLSVEDLTVTTTSGQVELEGVEAENLRAETVSGELEVFGNAEGFKLNTVSGAQHLRVSQCPEKAEFQTVSGKIQFDLPENVGFTAKYNSFSGRFRSDFPLTGDLDSKKGKAVYASGDASFSFSSTSGSMSICKVEERL